MDDETNRPQAPLAVTYGTAFDLTTRANPADVAAAVARVVARSAGCHAVHGVVPEWQTGTREVDVPSEGHRLRVSEHVHGDGLLWEASWSYPLADGLVAAEEPSVGTADGSLWFAFRAGTRRTDKRMVARVVPPGPPVLPGVVLSRYEVFDGLWRMDGAARRVGRADAAGFVDGVLLDPARTRPVVYVSHDPNGRCGGFDAERLAADLAGIAHVAYSLYALPDKEVSSRLGPLGCWGGAVRVYDPGMSLSDASSKHRLYGPSLLAEWKGVPFDRFLTRRLTQVAAVALTEPDGFRALRTASRTERSDRAAAEGDVETLRTDLRDALGMVDEAEQRVSEVEDELLDALAEAETLREQLDAAKLNIKTLSAEFARARAGAGPADAGGEPFGREAPEPPPETVLEAVERAEKDCPHLVFADAAFGSAAASQFRRPSDVLDALRKFDGLVAEMGSPEGLGTRPSDRAAQLGLDYAADVGRAARGKHRRHYERTWDGRKVVLGPHLRLGKGAGAQLCLRIYFAVVDGGPGDRTVVVGHVGEHLPDTTFG